MIISNWATFFKNLLLSLAAVWLIKFNRRAACLISPYLQWIATVAMAAYVLCVGFVGYRQQPLVDFRQYKIGTRLLGADDQPEYLPSFRFIYQKDGEQKAFGEDDELPSEDGGWTFVRREEVEFVPNGEAAPQAPQAPAADFRIWNEDASEDVTQSLEGVERQMILLIPDIRQLSMATSWKINRLYDMAVSQGIDFFAVASGQPDEIEQWRDLSSGQYAIYTAQDTSIKELVRGNPALVGLEDGVIKWKTALSAVILTDADAGDEAETASVINTSPVGIQMSGGQALLCLSVILVAILAVVAFASALRRFF